MIQLLIIAVLFTGALFYIGRMIYKSLTAKKGCGTDCKCGVDFSNAGPQKAGK
ncbi:FeoB-associated Cys-rich membrane protein [Mucilaginibacter sp.]